MGSGALGEVRQCINKKTGALRAVKIIRKDALDEKEKKRFFQEIEVMKQLDHPNIVKLYEVFQDDKRFYLVTELCTGGELFEEITKRQYFKEKETAKLIKQILSAAAYCHANGIVHRDLKPENLLIENKDNYLIKLIDFGTSCHYNKGSQMNQTYGTAYYIAPEVLTTEYNEKCDIWSIGVIMYILLTGKPPFQGRDDREIIKQVRKGVYNLAGREWKNISPEAKDLLQMMLQYNPDHRISASNALKHEWISLKAYVPQEEDCVIKSLQNLKNFRADLKLQQAAITFIVQQLASKDDLSDVQKAFQIIDSNCDGKLDKIELLAAYQKIMGNITSQDIDKILDRADADGSGFLDYSEFVVAAINKKKLLSNERLEAAFQLFDKDGGGSISAIELRDTMGFGNMSDDKIWNDIIMEVDDNGDGEISFEEFQIIMQKLMEVPAEDSSIDPFDSN